MSLDLAFFVIAAFRVFKCKIAFWVNGCCGICSLMFTVAIFTGENRKAWLSIIHIRSTSVVVYKGQFESHTCHSIQLSAPNTDCINIVKTCSVVWDPVRKLLSFFLLYDLTHHDQMLFCNSPWAVFSWGVGRWEILRIPSFFRQEKTRWHIGTWWGTSIFGL